MKMTVEMTKEEAAKLFKSTGFVVSAVDWTARKDSDVTLTLEPDQTVKATEAKEASVRG